MSTPAARARLDLTRLDDRTVPSTVNATTTARPLDFTATGTLDTTDPIGGGAITATSKVTLAGQLTYTSPADGTSGVVTVSGSGSGSGLPNGTIPPTGTDVLLDESSTDTGTRDFAQQVEGQFGFTDTGGTVSVNNPFGLMSAWVTPGGDSGTRQIGPLAATGTFDVSDFTLDLDLVDGGTGPGTGQRGTLSVTLADKTTAATDLAFSASAGTRAADGTVGLDFTVDATGKLMTAASHSAAAARVTAVWGDGAGRTETADLDVPVYWNAGKVVVSAAGLDAPEWATTLTVRLDATGDVTEADETNNEWTLTLADLPAAPPAGEEPPPAGEEPPPAGEEPPPTGGEPKPGVKPVGYSVTPGVNASSVDWRDATGRVIRSAVAFDGYGGDVTLAVGDVNGDDVLDVALGAGVGGAPRVRVLDGATGAELVNTFAYAEDFRGGVNVALGDLDGDGKAELIVGAGVGGGPHVRVIDVATGMERYAFMAYEEQARGGVFVTAADLNGDGTDELVTGAGVGGAPVEAVYDGPTGRQVQRVLAGAEDDRGGAKVRVEKAPDGFFVLSAESDTTGSLKRFRQQLTPGEPLLVAVTDAQLYPSELFAGVDPLQLS
ncbi:FG-GAP repeat protein [bacterium]|nr:FG-GAP repeat protein [bacterium]